MPKAIKVTLDNKSRKGEYWYFRHNKKSHYIKATVPEFIVNDWMNRQESIKNIESKEKRKLLNKIKRIYSDIVKPDTTKPVSQRQLKRKFRERLVKDMKSIRKPVKQETKPSTKKKKKPKAKPKAKKGPKLAKGIYAQTVSVQELLAKDLTVTQELFAKAGVALDTPNKLRNLAKKNKDNWNYTIKFIGKDHENNTYGVLADCYIHGLTPQEFNLKHGLYALSRIDEKEVKNGRYLKDHLARFSSYQLTTYARLGTIKQVRIEITLKL